MQTEEFARAARRPARAREGSGSGPSRPRRGGRPAPALATRRSAAFSPGGSCVATTTSVGAWISARRVCVGGRGVSARAVREAEDVGCRAPEVAQRVVDAERRPYGEVDVHRGVQPAGLDRPPRTRPPVQPDRRRAARRSGRRQRAQPPTRAPGASARRRARARRRSTGRPVPLARRRARRERRRRRRSSRTRRSARSTGRRNAGRSECCGSGPRARGPAVPRAAGRRARRAGRAPQVRLPSSSTQSCAPFTSIEGTSRR